MADVAALVVAVSAQLTKFEKDMKDLVNIANQRTKEVEDVFLKMNNTIVNQMSQLANTATAAFGPLGGIIAGLNPITLAVAAAVGALIVVFNSVSESIDKFVEKSKALQDTSNLTGLTVSQLKALGLAGRSVGVDFEQVERGLVRFAQAFDQLKQTGTGPLEKALERFPGLLKQVAQASDIGEAITLVSAAVNTLESSEARIGVTTDIVSKRNAEWVRVLELVAKQKILDPDTAITPAAKATDDLTKKITDLSRELAAVKKENEEFLAKLITVRTLESQVEYEKGLLRIKQRMVDLSSQAAQTNEDLSALPGFSSETFAPAQQQIQPLGADESAILPVIVKTGEAVDKVSTKTINWTEKLHAGLVVDIQQLNTFIGLLGQGATQMEQMIAKQLELQAAVDAGKLSEEGRARATAAFVLSQTQQTDALRERLGIATSQERIDSRLAQLAADKKNHDLSDNDALRARQFIQQDEANRLTALRDRLGILTQEQSIRGKINQMETEADKNQLSSNEKLKARVQIELAGEQAKESDRERLGIANESEIVSTRLNQLAKDAVYYGYSKRDVAAATLVIEKESKEVAEQQAARRSNLPETTRAGYVAADGWKQFDQVTTQTFSNFESSMASVANGTTTLAQAFKSMTNSIIADLVKMSLRLSITGPLQKLLGSLFTPTPGVGASVATNTGNLDAGWFAGLNTGSFIPQRQGGGPVSRNRPYLVGEHGTELFIPNSSGRIVPGTVARATGGGAQLVINNYTAQDTQVTQKKTDSGLSGERYVIDIVKKAQQRGDFDDSNRGRFALRPMKVR